MEIYIHAKQTLIKLLPLISLILLSTTIFAQNDAPLINSRLTGQVIDSATKQPVAGATLRIKGVTHEVASGSDGRFTFITGQKLPYTLVVSYIGYKTQEVYATGSPLNILLAENTAQLNDVVVMGYGTQKKSM